MTKADAPGARGERRRFVVHQHATGFQLELRLEIGGTLVSWSIPDAPSADPGEKLLAIRSADQPLDLAADARGRFDTGTFVHRSPSTPEQGLADGTLRIWLDGERLRGAYTLTRTRAGESQEQWLLVSRSGEGADDQRTAALSGGDSG
ncbi:DNA ligase D-like protein (predicted 3'-phosphoesterase) [Prauserella shujinwangii]|uniref:DNA ligase D-like protein (Predicted 3'-phosphoesterase) n=1 Tax=Prauserella shujinwangii TaxID=1453103 RepID=A0A2T0LQ36_9PSEU|nr:DNA polymerase ligase N-terminal domain-containing protein [Prauserella shujinwangii]PRX45372.1 DNA ligase D-like protein (predicted 3'-phosphoesterase) [Prauserella shujinwangii]